MHSLTWFETVVEALTIGRSDLEDVLLEALTHLLEPGQTMHDAIASLNDKYSLTGFREILPSMHEIFVETVNSNEVYE